jgi:8-oxo-dGTP diphosphatase
MNTNQTIVGSLCWIFDHQRVLMIRRNKFPNQGLWAALGGRIEVGESPLDCVIREVNEESGLVIANPDLRGIVSIFHQDIAQHWILFIYIVENPEGFLTATEGELAWVPVPIPKEFPIAKTDHVFFTESTKSDHRIFQASIIYDSQERFDVVITRPIERDNQ